MERGYSPQGFDLGVRGYSGNADTNQKSAVKPW